MKSPSIKVNDNYMQDLHYHIGYLRAQIEFISDSAKEKNMDALHYRVTDFIRQVGELDKTYKKIHEGEQ